MGLGMLPIKCWLKCHFLLEAPPTPRFPTPGQTLLLYALLAPYSCPSYLITTVIY